MRSFVKIYIFLTFKQVFAAILVVIEEQIFTQNFEKERDKKLNAKKGNGLYELLNLLSAWASE